MRTPLMLPAALLLSGCMAAAVPVAELGVAPALGAAQAKVLNLEEKLHVAVYGEPSICDDPSIAQTDLYCKLGSENAARDVALGKPTASYASYKAAVARCDAAKIPDPPLNEKDCDRYREVVQKIDARAAELKKAGVV